MAPGISALADALADLADVMVAAPDRERSAASHSISLDRPLRVDQIRSNVYAIDGTPVDCVYLALLHLVPRKPDLCVSGINNGFNLGTDVFYSGTVGAALEAALRGVPAIAHVGRAAGWPQDFAPAAGFARSLVRQVLAQGPDAIEAGTPAEREPSRRAGARICHDLHGRAAVSGSSGHARGSARPGLLLDRRARGEGRGRSRLGQRGRAFRLGVDHAAQSGPHPPSGLATDVRLEPGHVRTRRSGSTPGNSAVSAGRRSGDTPGPAGRPDRVRRSARDHGGGATCSAGASPTRACWRP